ncbi:MAG: hypothetical protein JWL77_1947 [Chthonomonadaceae bacterium]|nr:hypothetical protein [Chthonomonadaceae bacterium]
MWKQKGLHNEVWASEILAFLAGQWFLRERSFGEQVEALELRLIDFDDRVPILQLQKSVRKTGIVAKLRRDFYPPDFSQHIYRLATALVLIVDREGMAQMVGARDLSDWIDNLSTPQDVLVRCALGELDFGALPENAYYLNQYGYVCLLLGDKEGAVQSYLKALELCPRDADIRTWLEYALARVSVKQKEKVHE